MKEEYFLKSIYATRIKEFGEYIAKILVVTINKIGVKNLIHVVMNKAPSCKKASRLVKEIFSDITNTACTTHKINLVLKDCENMN